MLLARRANSSMLQRSSANRPSSACLRCAAWAGWPGTARRRRRECSLPVRPSAHSLSSVGAAAASDRAHHYTTNSKWPLRLPPSLPLSLSEASPAPVHRRRFVASGSGMDGRMGERTGGREGGSLMLQPFQKAADSLARTLGWPLCSPPSLTSLSRNTALIGPLTTIYLGIIATLIASYMVVENVSGLG